MANLMAYNRLPEMCGLINLFDNFGKQKSKTYTMCGGYKTIVGNNRSSTIVHPFIATGWEERNVHWQLHLKLNKFKMLIK